MLAGVSHEAVAWRALGGRGKKMPGLRRFSQRLAKKQPDDVLYDGVPAHLELPLRRWLYGDLAANRQAQRIAVHLRMPVDAANVDNFVAERQPRDLLVSRE
jgi:hypothetical protein